MAITYKFLLLIKVELLLSSVFSGLNCMCSQLDIVQANHYELKTFHLTWYNSYVLAPAQAVEFNVEKNAQ